MQPCGHGTSGMIGQISGGQNPGQLYHGARKRTANSCSMSPALGPAGPKSLSQNGLDVVAQESWWIQTVSHMDKVHFGSADLKVELIGLRVERAENSQSCLGASPNNLVSSACLRYKINLKALDIIPVAVDWPACMPQTDSAFGFYLKIKWCNRIYEVKH